MLFLILKTLGKITHMYNFLGHRPRKNKQRKKKTGNQRILSEALYECQGEYEIRILWPKGNRLISRTSILDYSRLEEVRPMEL